MSHSFSELSLSPNILKAISDKAYTQPTDIQQQAIPAILDGEDVVASAPTGTGKTASFVLPMLHRLSGDHARRGKRIRGLVLVPTRELALQVGESIGDYGKHLVVHSAVMVGGVDYEPQKQALIDGIDILVATPGRLIDMLRQRALYLDELKMLVIDE